MIYCSNCGAMALPGEKFCGSCGAPIGTPAAGAAAQAPVQPPGQSAGMGAPLAAGVGAVAAGIGAAAAGIGAAVAGIGAVGAPAGAPAAAPVYVPPQQSPYPATPGGAAAPVYVPPQQSPPYPAAVGAAAAPAVIPYGATPGAPAPAGSVGFPGPGAAQPVQQAVPVADGPYAPPAAAQPAPSAARCELGHEIQHGSSYCTYGHPIALGNIQFAGGDPFGGVPVPVGHEAGALPPTGAMSPYPSPPQANIAPQPQPYPYVPPQAAMQPMAQPAAAGPADMQPQAALPMQATPQQVGPYAPPPAPAGAWPAPGSAAATPVPGPADGVNLATTPEVPAVRQLTGFLYSFHAGPNGVFWPLYAGRNLVGRTESGEKAHIEIADPTTSSRHACIVCDVAVAVAIEDEGSTNGTFVNDQPIGYRGRAELHDGDRVRFGAYNAAIRLVSR